MKRSALLAAATTIALALAACSGGDDSTQDTAGSTTTPDAATVTIVADATAESAEAPLPDVIRQPLTGEPINGGANVVGRPALAVTIDNHPDARQNHSGLAVADIVYEQIVEGGFTRFLAVLHTNDSDLVGPIRSGRSHDVALLAPLDVPLYAWSGGNPGVNRLIAEAPVVDLSALGGAAGYFRGPGVGPHDLYNDTESLWDQTPSDHAGAPRQQFEYTFPGESFVGTEIAGFDLRIGDLVVGWNWDAAAGSWRRSQDGVEHIDVTHGPIASTNVVVMVVAYGRSSIDVNSPEARTVGEGLAVVFSDGKAVEGRWARSAENEPIAFLDETGDPLALTPGSTWVELAAGDPENPVAPISSFP